MGETAPGDAAEHLQEAGVAGAVDADRPRHDHLQMTGLAGRARQVLALELRPLVHVAGRQRRVFVRRRVLDVPVHPPRAAVHEAGDARSAGRVDQGARAERVHRAVRCPALPRAAIAGRDVVHDVDTGARGAERCGIGQVAEREIHARSGERIRPVAADRAHQTPHLTALAREGAGEVPASEAGRPGYQHSHA